MFDVNREEYQTMDKAGLNKERSEITAYLSKYEETLSNLHKDLEEAKNRNPQTLTATDSFRIQELEKQLDTTQLQHSELIYKRNIIDQRLDNLKLVKKSLCLSNIRYLLKENPGIKIGQIESDGDVSTGYTSKLEKPENKTDPPIEYIAAAAKAFNVSIDALLYAPLAEMTASERYLLRFIENLEKDTIAETMVWEKEPSKALNPVNVHTVDLIHPLLVPDQTTYDGYGHYDEAHFESRFIQDKYVTVSGSLYHTTLTGTNSTLYIVSEAVYEKQEDKFGICGYELFIVDSESVTPVFNTLQAHSAIDTATRKLYYLIKESSTHVKLNRKARNLIDAYMNPQASTDTVSQAKPFDIFEGDGELPF